MRLGVSDGAGDEDRNGEVDIGRAESRVGFEQRDEPQSSTQVGKVAGIEASS